MNVVTIILLVLLIAGFVGMFFKNRLLYDIALFICVVALLIGLSTRI